MQVGLLIPFAIVLASATVVAAVASTQTGIASIYSTESGTKTASGERLNPTALTAAHRSLPFGSRARVTNRKNGRSILVTINDRGPFVRGRIIDLTPAGARALGFSGLASVTVESDASAASRSAATPPRVARVRTPRPLQRNETTWRCLPGEPTSLRDTAGVGQQMRNDGAPWHGSTSPSQRHGIMFHCRARLAARDSPSVRRGSLEAKID